MISPVTNVIRVNQHMAKEMANKWEQASCREISAYCLQILQEIGCSCTELPENFRSREQQLNLIAGFASYAFGEVENVQNTN